MTSDHSELKPDELSASDNHDPFTAPGATENSGEFITNDEAIALRKEHVFAEWTVRLVGLLCLLWGSVCLYSIRKPFFEIFSAFRPGSTGIIPTILVGTVLAVTLGISLLVAGIGLLRLWRVGQAAAAFVTVIALIGWLWLTRFAYEPALNGMIGIDTNMQIFALACGAAALFLVFRPKALAVFRPAYARVISQAPGIRYKPPRVAWFLLCPVLGFLALLALAIAMNS